MKLLQINITANWGSHGKIAEGIGQLAIKEGWKATSPMGAGVIPANLISTRLAA